MNQFFFILTSIQPYSIYEVLLGKLAASAVIICLLLIIKAADQGSTWVQDV